MSNVYEIVGVSAAIIGILGYIPYIISILKGDTRPNKASWFIWTVVGGLLAVSYLAEGNQTAIWLPLAYFICPLVIALLSFRYGYSAWTRIDTLCILAAALSLIPWMLSHNATLTLLINLLIDSAGAIPTIVKTYREPKTEDCTAWVLFLIANTLNLFAISTWNIADIYPIYLFVLASTMVALILKDKIKRGWSLISHPATEKK